MIDRPSEVKVLADKPTAKLECEVARIGLFRLTTDLLMCEKAGLRCQRQVYREESEWSGFNGRENRW